MLAAMKENGYWFDRHSASHIIHSQDIPYGTIQTSYSMTMEYFMLQFSVLESLLTLLFTVSSLANNFRK